MAPTTPRTSPSLNGYRVRQNCLRLDRLARKVWQHLTPRARLRYLRQRRKLLNPYRSDEG